MRQKVKRAKGAAQRDQVLELEVVAKGASFGEEARPHPKFGGRPGRLNPVNFWLDFTVCELRSRDCPG